MKKQLPNRIEKLLKDVKKNLQQLYGNRLSRIILYGSYGRGDYTPDSDIDIMVILKHRQNYLAERKRYLKPMWKLGFKYDRVISVLPLGIDEYNNRRLPVILNAKKEGRAL